MVGNPTSYEEVPDCTPSTTMVLEEAYELPGCDLPAWIAVGFHGGICLSDICGALSGAVVTIGLIAY